MEQIPLGDMQRTWWETCWALLLFPPYEIPWFKPSEICITEKVQGGWTRKPHCNKSWKFLQSNMVNNNSTLAFFLLSEAHHRQKQLNRCWNKSTIVPPWSCNMDPEESLPVLQSVGFCPSHLSNESTLDAPLDPLHWRRELQPSTWQKGAAAIWCSPGLKASYSMCTGKKVVYWLSAQGHIYLKTP